MNLIPFKNIDEQDEFWCGARFVKKKKGLRLGDSEQDYFEFMLIGASSMEWMICTHIDQFEAGAVISHVKTTTLESQRYTVTAKEFRRSNILDDEIDLWYYSFTKYDRYWSQDIKSVIKKLDKISFHDIEVIGLNINFSYSFVSIDFELYNEIVKDYEKWTIEFQKFTDFKSDSLLLNSDSSVEITSFEYELIELFEGKMTFLLGSEQPSFELLFKCEKVKLLKS